MTIRKLISSAARRLETASHVSNPHREAEEIASYLLRVDLSYLLAHPEAPVKGDLRCSMDRLVSRRRRGEPLAYLFGSAWFYGRRFRVTPAVLIPRPETELLAEQAIRAAHALDAVRCLDIGTGSGILAITLALETDAAVVATDVSSEALSIALQNAENHGTAVSFVEADGATPFLGDTFDLIVANPPYVAHEEKGELPPDVRDHEPELALYSPGGLAHLESWLHSAGRLLRRGGRLFFEIGYGQQDEAIALARKASLREIAVSLDLASIPRVLSARPAPKRSPGA